MFEVMAFAEKPRDVGRQRGQHFLALRLTPRSRHQLAILTKIREAEDAQALGEARVNQRRLRFLQIDAGVAIDHLGDPTKVVDPHHELAGNDLRGIASLRRVLRDDGHAASPTTFGIRLSKAIRLTKRSSIVITPRTNDLAISEPIAGVGCTLSAGWAVMSETASTSSPIICRALCKTMMTWRDLGTAGVSPKRSARSTIGSTIPRRFITPRTNPGACGSAVAGVQPRISRTDIISTQKYCVP